MKIFFLIVTILLLSIKVQAGFRDAEANYNQGKYDIAFDELVIYAERGNPSAQFMVSQMYLNGQGTKLHKEEGMAWINKAADMGYLPALNYLESLSPNKTNKNKSTEIEDPTYIFLSRHAATDLFYKEDYSVNVYESLKIHTERGFIDSQFITGLFLIYGLGSVKKDEQSGERLVSESASYGYPDAINYLSLPKPRAFPYSKKAHLTKIDEKANQKIEQDNFEKEKRKEALSKALKDTSEMYEEKAKEQRQRNTNCSSIMTGNQIFTNCY